MLSTNFPFPALQVLFKSNSSRKNLGIIFWKGISNLEGKTVLFYKPWHLRTSCNQVFAATGVKHMDVFWKLLEWSRISLYDGWVVSCIIILCLPSLFYNFNIIVHYMIS